MLRTITVLVLSLLTLAGLPGWGQERVRPFALGRRPVGVSGKVERVRVVELDVMAVKALRRRELEEVLLVLPLPDGETAEIAVERSGVVPRGQRIRQTAGGAVEADRGLHYHATHKKDLAAFSVFDLGREGWLVTGLFSHGGTTWVLAPDSVGRLVLFAEAEMPGKNPFRCHTTSTGEPSLLPGADPAPPAPLACPTSIKFFVETDYQCYVDNGYSDARTVAWINGVWNVVGQLYARIDIPVEVKTLYLHTVPDNWPTVSNAATIIAFNDSLRRRGPEQDLQHLVSTRPLNHGGIAGTSVLCAAGNRPGYSNVRLSYAQLPAYSWTVNCITHEVGHNLSSQHTQDCTWELQPGRFGSIDSCYMANGPSGQPCFPAVRLRVGTIMSYCHIQASIDPNLGFGPLPTAKIQRYFQQSQGCLTPASTIPGVAVAALDTACEGERLQLTASGPAGSTYNWTGPAGFSSTDASPVIPAFAAQQAGTYAVTVSNGACTSEPYPVEVVANCIPSVYAGRAALCVGDSVPVGYQALFVPQVGNVFEVEVSEADGRFSITPPVVGRLAGVARQGSIPVVMPLGYPAGNRYRLRVRASSPAKSGMVADDSVTVKPGAAAPIGTGAQRPDPGVLSLQAMPPAGLEAVWYGDSLGAGFLHKGTTYQTPPLTASRRYWAGSERTANASVGLPNRLSGATAAGFVNQGMNFTVLAPMVLDSLRIQTSRNGTSYFEIRNRTTGQRLLLDSQAVRAIPQIGAKTGINLRLEPGSYQIVVVVSNNMPWLYQTTGTANLGYPFTIGGVVRIDSAMTTARQGLKTWNFYYDWKVRPLACPSALVPVQAVIGPCPDVAAPALSQRRDTLFSSLTGPHRWWLDGRLTVDSLAYVPAAALGDWTAVALLSPCPSDTAGPFRVTGPTAVAGGGQSVHVYPNPAGDRLAVAGARGFMRFAITNLLGQEVLSGTFAPDLDLSGLTAGSYVLRLSGGGLRPVAVPVMKR